MCVLRRLSSLPLTLPTIRSVWRVWCVESVVCVLRRQACPLSLLPLPLFMTGEPGVGVCGSFFTGSLPHCPSSIILDLHPLPHRATSYPGVHSWGHRHTCITSHLIIRKVDSSHILLSQLTSGLLEVSYCLVPPNS